MKDLKRIEKIYRKTDGYCHLCHKKLSLKNYGLIGTRGAWQIEHSIPKAKGGTNHMNNLFPSCVPCNLEKGVKSTKSIRVKKGVNRAPLSKQKKDQLKSTNVTAGALIGGTLGIVGGPIGMTIGAIIGGAIGGNNTPKK